jgi:hypothetical protein
MLPFVVDIQCQNVVNTILMTLRCVVGCERSLLRMPSFLCKRLLLGQKTVAKVDRNGLGLTKMHPFALKN